MKTSQSFFPTRTHLKSRELHRDHTLQLVKLKDSLSSTETPTEPTNIFRDRNNPAFKQQHSNAAFRPVGGPNLFRKIMEKHSKEESSDSKKQSKRSNRDNTIRNISSSGLKTRKERGDQEEQLEFFPLKSIVQNVKETFQSDVPAEQFLKSHASYTPSSSKIQKNTLTTVKCFSKSENMYRPATSKPGRHDAWTASQRKQYQDKSALLNEINFTRPLIEVYGDRYFQYLLRNRFEDDLKPAPYVYLISDQKFANSKAISKIKEHRPDIRQRQMMVLKGNKIAMKTQDY